MVFRGFPGFNWHQVGIFSCSKTLVGIVDGSLWLILSHKKNIEKTVFGPAHLAELGSVDLCGSLVRTAWNSNSVATVWATVACAAFGAPVNCSTHKFRDKSINRVGFVRIQKQANKIQQLYKFVRMEGAAAQAN